MLISFAVLVILVMLSAVGCDAIDVIITIAGGNTHSYSGDNGPATSATLNPYSVSLDLSGSSLNQFYYL